MQAHDWEGCPKLETVAWAWATLCWWICTRSRVPVTLHSSGFTYSWPSALTYWLQRSLREGDTPWLQLLFSALSSCSQAAGFEAGSSPGSRTIRSVSFVRIDGEFDMLTFSFSQLLPRMLPWHSLQFHSTSFNFLTGREARGARSVSCPPPYHPHPAAPFFISVQKSEQVWISYFRLVRTRLCGNNPSSPPGAETQAGSWYRTMVSTGSDTGF